MTIVLAGATGLVGGGVAARLPQAQLLVRRALPGRASALDPAAWPARVAALCPDTLLIALGTTWKRAGRSEAAFRAVDHDLVLALAQAAWQAGTRQLIVVSAIGASPRARTLYSRVKGEVEAALTALAFPRLDILRPGLLTGTRTSDPRPLESLGIRLAPLFDPLLTGKARRYRSIPADSVAGAMAALVGAQPDGRFVHEHDAMLALAAQPNSAA